VLVSTSTGEKVKSIAGGSIGNLIEWYDWLVYSAFSLYFAKSFFPHGNQSVQLLNTAAVFAVGYLMRPIGGVLLGIYADRKGRKAALILSVLLMSGGALLISITPSYKTIGIAAPVVLISARLVQGISIGGEYGASATYLSEIGFGKWRGFYSSFQCVTRQGGQLMATAVMVLLLRVLITESQQEGWGWRIPFFLCAALSLAAFYLRRNMEETRAFRLHRDPQPSGNLFLEMLRYKRAVATVAGLTLGGTVAIYTHTVYMQKFLVNTGGFSRAASSLISASTLLFLILLKPVVGALSDVVGRRPVLMGFGVLGTLATVPLLTAISQAANVWSALALVLAGMVIVSGYTAVSAVTKAELFPTECERRELACPMPQWSRWEDQRNMLGCASRWPVTRIGSIGMSLYAFSSRWRCIS